MNEINIEQILEDKNIHIFRNNSFLKNSALNILKKILHNNEINNFLELRSDITGIEFIDEVFEYLNFSFKISSTDIQKIPAEGRVIVTANHPIGSLDSLALIKAISIVRKDIKIIANDILSSIDNISEFILPIDIENISFQRERIIAISKALESEYAVIIFPAGEVSRLKGFTITDSKWNKSPIFLSNKYHAPILPVFIQSKNSIFFYILSIMNKRLSIILLSHELFNKKNKHLEIKIGNPIPAKTFNSSIKNSVYIKLLMKHVYKIGKRKPGLFATEKNIIHPIDCRLIRKELKNSKKLIETKDNKTIFYVEYNHAPNVMKEISRLREITFRKVGEGTGNKNDIDKFDKHYSHLIVWDDDELEIVGAYRIGMSKQIFDKYGIDGFYSSTLFNFSEDFIHNVLPYSIELGRSFVRQKYWNSNALDYLWQGIGAIIATKPELKYLFGPVSISEEFSNEATSWIIAYLNKWFKPTTDSVLAKTPFAMDNVVLEDKTNYLNSNIRKVDFNKLKIKLKEFNLKYPVLYKHYSEVAEDDGVKFNAFNVDTHFSNCVDAFLQIEIEKIKEKKKERYILSHLKKEFA
jgi:putative hemolysin